MRFTVLLFGILFTANCLKAQNATENLTIFGQVKVMVGKQAMQPFEMIWIKINELDIITMTDSLGRFKLDINSDLKVNFCH